MFDHLGDTHRKVVVRSTKEGVDLIATRVKIRNPNFGHVCLMCEILCLHVLIASMMIEKFISITFPLYANIKFHMFNPVNF